MPYESLAHGQEQEDVAADKDGGKPTLAGSNTY